MDSSEADLDRVEAQRSTDVSRGQRKRRYFLVSLIKHGVQLGSYSVSSLFSDFRLSDFFAFSGVYVPMSPEIFSAVSEGDAECMTKLRSSVTPAECLRSDQGDSVLHLAAAGGHVELVKTIASTWPFLLMELDSKDQLPLHVAARARHGSVVNTLIDIVTFLSNKMSAARSERLNPYVLKNKDGDTALHLAMKCLNVYCVIPLGETYPQAWFLANNKGISPLFIAVQEGFTELVKYLLENLDNDETDLQLEGRKDLVHVALKARNTDIIDVILKKYPSLENERDEEGMTCLSFGASIGFYKGVCNLLDRSTRVVFAILIRCPNSKHLLNRKGPTDGEARYRWEYTSAPGYHIVAPSYYLSPSVSLQGKLHEHSEQRWSNISGYCRVKSATQLHLHGEGDTDGVIILLHVSKTIYMADVQEKDNKTNRSTCCSEPNQGLPTLAGDRKLTYFMVFDILAMQSSIVTIATLIWAQLGLVIFLDVASAVFIFLMLFLLGPHVLLRIPGIPAAFGAYFVLFVLLVDDDHHEQASPAKISSEEASAAKSSSEEASAAKISVTTKKNILADEEEETYDFDCNICLDSVQEPVVKLVSCIPLVQDLTSLYLYVLLWFVSEDDDETSHLQVCEDGIHWILKPGSS
ncbi:BnaA09g01580D [Brassica napus]|uniref:BnaA09g01580D protein n=1 Tax=Brassica napus TaxID=3708 RepID=A0A078IF23_BRANA|nr:BnaA09g01580D [Brassica napus]